jgi:outer membrane protein OmpA-like peptidoglycan-associated protein
MVTSSVVRLLLVLAAASAAFSAAALSTAHRTLEVDVDFQDRSTILTATELQKLQGAVDTVRGEDWCGFAFALVTAHALTSEGSNDSLQDLSDRRALYVAELLERLGVPKSRIYFEGKSDRHTSAGWAAGRRVELQFRAEGSENKTSTPCPIPKNSHGFRVRS